MQLRGKSAASAAAALLIHSLVVALPPAVFAAPLAAPDGGAYGESSASPQLANSSPLFAAADPLGVALASSLYRRFIEPVTGVIIGGGLAVAGTMGVKQLAEKSRSPFKKKSAGDATGATAGKNKKKSPNQDEIKHVTVGGGLLGEFQLANKIRTRAQNKINTHFDTGGCVVVHNKINGQYGL
ncbi:hypothetical protein DFJ73DRAFT_905616 [Zopfochytrium polystomum]|nr:hypothetical protein DFJ73DRAFT_905616 [Zopfochytrium polystomum]